MDENKWNIFCIFTLSAEHILSYTYVYTNIDKFLTVKVFTNESCSSQTRGHDPSEGRQISKKGRQNFQ